MGRIRGWRRGLGCVLVVVALLPLTPCCTPERSQEAPATKSTATDRPNIVLVVACTFVYDHLSGAGYGRPTTPFLDSLASRGVFFENAVSASSWTQPSTTSILTGLTPNVHGMTQYHGTRDVAERSITPERTLPDDIVTIAECLKDAGYDTFCRINNIQAGHFFNIPQGFDDGKTDGQMQTPAMIDDLRTWLTERDSGKPFFAFLMTRDMHFVFKPDYAHYLEFADPSAVVREEDYPEYPKRLHQQIKALLPGRVPDDLQRRYLELYDGELAQFDDALGALPAVLKRADAENTVLVVTGDHGERLFKRDQLVRGWGFDAIGHGWMLDDEVVHVPLIAAGPGIPTGRRIDQVVRSIDLYPTLATLAVAQPPGIVQGVNLLPLMRGEATDPLTAFATFTRDATTMHMVREGQYKLHVSGRRMALYDIDHDPLETQDVAQEKPQIAGRLRTELGRWLELESLLAKQVSSGGEKALTPAEIEQLRTLGYID